MTTPTQAQIEAEHRVVIYAAACNPEATGDNAAAVLRHIIKVARIALTAAAEVGEQERNPEIEKAFNDGYEDAKETYVAATIERCAQVAENCGGDEREISLGQWIAAEIRELKDK